MNHQTKTAKINFWAQSSNVNFQSGPYKASHSEHLQQTVVLFRAFRITLQYSGMLTYVIY